MTQILERHLVISDVAYTMEKIKVLTGDTNTTPFNYYKHKEIELPTVRDSLSMFVEERQDHSKLPTSFCTQLFTVLSPRVHPLFV